MSRYKFRAWDKKKKSIFPVHELEFHKIDQSLTKCVGYDDWDQDGYTMHGGGNMKYANEERYILMQYTGLTDRNGKEIYEGDIVRVRRPGRDQQTHYGDNIPLGSYTEPLEPIIYEYVTKVKCEDGIFGCECEDEDHDVPLKWVLIETTAENEHELMEMFSGGWGHRIFEGWEYDKGYLFETYGVTSVDELMKYIGIEVIGNIYEHPHLIES